MRRQALRRAVNDPDWSPEVASAEGAVLRDLSELGWVELIVDGYSYRPSPTERGRERDSAWGDASY